LARELAKPLVTLHKSLQRFSLAQGRSVYNRAFWIRLALVASDNTSSKRSQSDRKFNFMAFCCPGELAVCWKLWWQCPCNERNKAQQNSDQPHVSTFSILYSCDFVTSFMC
jgi:hypothetical protein